MTQTTEIKKSRAKGVVSQAHNTDKLKSVSHLLNSFKYFLQHVLILCYGDYFRLLVIHECKLLSDRCYKSFKGAKIAFLKLFSDKAWKPDVIPEWSVFYNPGIESINQVGKIEQWF